MDIKSPPKVLISPTVLPEFRHSFYNLLAQRGKAFIHVAHGVTSNDKPIFEAKFEKLFTEHVINNHHYRLGGFDILLQFGLVKILKTQKIDVIISQANFGNLSNLWVLPIAKLMGIKVIFWMCGWEKSGLSPLKKAVKTFFSKIQLLFSDGGIAYGSFGREVLLQLGMAENKITIAPNTIESRDLINKVDSVDRVAARAKFGIPAGSTVIYFMGKMSPQKKIDKLVHIIAEMNDPNLFLVLAGDGPSRVELIELTERLGMSERSLIPGVIITEKPEFYAMADVAVMPGLGGLFLNEAMAAGLPVVVGESDGTHLDLLNDPGNGILFDPTDEDGLKNGIAQALSLSPSEKKAMGQRARKKIQLDFTLEQMCLGFEERIIATLQ